MKTRSIVLVILLALSGVGGEPARASEWPFRIVTVAGPSQTYSKSGRAWTAATLRAELGPDEAARTLGGRLTLTSPSDQALRLAPFSRLSFVAAGAADQPTPVKMEGGSIWVAVLPGSPPAEQIEVETSAMTVTVKGSGVEISIGRDGGVLVRVYHGSAECAGPGRERKWSKSLADEQEMLVSSTGAPGEFRKMPRDKVDADWVKWNEDQDRAGGYGERPRPK
jgi:FecR-like protein